MDFAGMIKRGESFVASAGSWAEYRHWLATEAKCTGCGAKCADRKRDKNGVVIELWATETMCGKCFGLVDSADEGGQ